MMSTWVMCQRAPGRCHKFLPLLQHQGSIGQKVLCVHMIPQHSCLTYTAQPFKTPTMISIMALQKGLGGSCNLVTFIITVDVSGWNLTLAWFFCLSSLPPFAVINYSPLSYSWWGFEKKLIISTWIWKARPLIWKLQLVSLVTIVFSLNSFC